MRPIVLVEDHESIRDVLAELLSLEGFPVVEVRTVTEAIDTLRGLEHPAVVLLDLVLPDAPGEALLEALSTWTHRHRVIVVSAVAAQRLEAVRSSPFVDAVFSKPFGVDELLLAIRRIASPRAHQRPSNS